MQIQEKRCMSEDFDLIKGKFGYKIMDDIFKQPCLVAWFYTFQNHLTILSTCIPSSLCLPAYVVIVHFQITGGGIDF